MNNQQGDYHCFRCGTAVSVLPTTGKVGRRDDCPSYGADLHVCKNCRFYDATAYNQCREPQAERVVEKERSNFVTFLDFGLGRGAQVLVRAVCWTERQRIGKSWRSFLSEYRLSQTLYVV